MKVARYLKRCFRKYRLFRKFLPFFDLKDPLEAILLKRKIDLVYFLSPSSWALDFEELNYITTVWDLSHRDDMEFPEVRAYRNFEARELCYRGTLPKAVGVVVDSDLGKKNVIHRYGLDENRVHIIPFSPPPQFNDVIKERSEKIDIRKTYSSDLPYVYYPAQFWAHKNHIYLLEGLKRLEQKHGIILAAIFSGSDWGNLEHVKQYAMKLGIADRVKFLGFVENELVVQLYKQSVALVMPTYFGPTNLPPLEAFKIGVPVLYSDKSGMREQVADAALLMDLNNPDNMAQSLADLITNKKLSKRLVSNGKKVLQNLNHTDRATVLALIIKDFKCRRKCWGHNNV
jgi:glycosyltransferase involved in cell wall biosynthesis